MIVNYIIKKSHAGEWAPKVVETARVPTYRAETLSHRSGGASGAATSVLLTALTTTKKVRRTGLLTYGNYPALPDQFEQIHIFVSYCLLEGI